MKYIVEEQAVVTRVYHVDANSADEAQDIVAEGAGDPPVFDDWNFDNGEVAVTGIVSADPRIQLRDNTIGLTDECGFHPFTFVDEGLGYVTVLLGDTGDPWEYNVPAERASAEYGYPRAS